MRRGTRGRGYGGRPPAFQRAQNNIPRQLQPPQSNNAPMMSDHLQGLKDIDMELELLKRKREIIEKQQQILSNSTYRQHNDYEQPVVSQARESRYEEFTRLYDNPEEPNRGNYGRDGYQGGRSGYQGGREQQGSRGNHRGGRGGYQNRGEHETASRKRPHVPVWENEVPPKRFSTPSRGGKKPFAPRSSPVFQRPPEPAPRPRRPPPPPPQKKRDFNPSKVSKPTVAPALKLANYQPAERRRLVAATVASGATSADDALVLRADREPTHLMRGRLELALGAIMKDVKTANPHHDKLFRQPQALRAMKQCVRDRIRTAMVGRPVAVTDQIKAAYYELFPAGDDDEVVTKGLMAQENKDFIVVDSVNPETYFKKNMRTLMMIKMEEMINKLGEIYSDAAPSTPKKPQRYRYRNKYNERKQQTNTQADAKPETIEIIDENTEPKTEGETESIIEPKQDDKEVKADEIINLDENSTDLTIEPPIVDIEKPETLTSQDDSNVNIDKPVVSTNGQENPIVNIDKPAISAGKENVKVDIEKPAISTDKEISKVNIEKAAISTGQENPKVNTDKAAKPTTIEVPKELICNEKYKALDRLLTYKMLQLLRRYTPDFVRFMDVDAMYRKTKAMIISETAKKLGRPLNKQDNEVDPSAVGGGQAATVQMTHEKRSSLYFVKILGKPSLPKRKAMEHFFEQFKPKTIKKHRTIHNLLFVGFLEKETFENILAADGTTIGRFTLDIKVSERADIKKNPNKANIPATEDENKLDVSTDSIIGADLDDQITDLLSSIRKNEMENFDDDIVMTEPNEVKGETEAFKSEDTNNAENDNDIVEFKDVPQDDAVEIKDGAQDETNDAQNDVIEVEDGQNAIEHEFEDQNAEEGNQNDDVDEAQDNDVVDIKDVQNEAADQSKPEHNDAVDKAETVGDLKSDAKDVKSTPTRASARLATPGGIRTRRMSKLPE